MPETFLSFRSLYPVPCLEYSLYKKALQIYLNHNSVSLVSVQAILIGLVVYRLSPGFWLHEIARAYILAMNYGPQNREIYIFYFCRKDAKN